MANYIKKFQTISAHEASLRQAPAAIECLVNVLKYIKEILDDDSTSTLFEMIGHHLHVRDNHAHYLNIELLSDQFFTALRYAFISIGVYTSENSTEHQAIDFFRDVYDGKGLYTGSKILTLPSEYSDPGLIPDDYTDFAKWLMHNPNIYTSGIPLDYDAFCIGLTLRLAKEWFRVNHDTVVDAHASALSDRLDKIMAISRIAPSYWFSPSTFDSSFYNLIDPLDYRKLMDLVDARLLATGSPHVIDYHTYPDTAALPLTLGYDEASLNINTFFGIIFPNVDDDYSTYLVQLDTSSIRAATAGGGAITFEGWSDLIADTGETDGKFTNRKYVDYYHDHLSFVLSDTMTPEYRDILSLIRGTVNTSYNKVYHVNTVLNKNNFGIELTVNVNHLPEQRTLDLINVVGLSKSVFAVSLVPYRDINNVLFNKVVIAFDNYNPAFTATMIDKIAVGELVSFNMVVSASLDRLTVHLGLGDVYNEVHFDNTNRMYDVDPYFLFVVPRIDEYKRNTTRLANLKLYGKALNDDDAFAIISSFRHV